MPDLDVIGEQIGGADIEQHEGHHGDEGAEEQTALIVAENLDQRHLDAFFCLNSFLKLWCLGDRQPHPQTDGDQDDRGNERHAPAPAQKRILGYKVQQHPEDAGGQEKPDRRAQLREHTVPRALAFRSVFSG